MRDVTRRYTGPWVLWIAAIVLLGVSFTVAWNMGGVPAQPGAPASGHEGQQRNSEGEPVPSGSGHLYVVSPVGSDDEDGSQNAPWRTLNHALEQLRAGDTLLVRAGTYEEDIDARISP